MNWLFSMAWRDIRRNPTRLFIFISSIVLGIASLVAINSFSENLQQDIDNQAKELLGADLVLNVTQELKPEARKFLDSLGGKQAREVNFASMVLFPKNNGSRLVQVRALEGDYPFYGNIKTEPVQANKAFLSQQKAIVDHTLLIQFSAKKGDSVRVGNINFEVEGEILKLPGQTGIAASVAPVVYIPLKFLDQTNLVQKGSRVNYTFYYQFDQNFDVEKLLNQIRSRLEKEKITAETVGTRKKNTSKAFQNLNDFLNLVGFVALLLGCVGVASSVHVYVKEKISTIAILRCLGASGGQTFAIFLIQTVFMGFIGSVLGAFLGAGIQTILPVVFADFLPLSMTLQISWKSVWLGVGIGTGISLLFSLLPLISVRQISPLRALRMDFEEKLRFDPLLILIYALILGFILCFSFLQIGNWKDALIFTVALLVAFLLLAGMAQISIWLLRKYFPHSLAYVWRQGLANLYRPNNQTLILVLCIGLGTALIATLFFIQDLLISQVTLRNQGSQPNMILFDIQNPQKEAVKDLTKKMNLPILQETPIITMRLFAVNGKNREEMKKDSIYKPENSTKKVLRVPEWAIDREYRVTYRDTIASASEELTEGVWRGKVTEKDSIFVSFDGDYAKRMNVKLGDKLTFDVQGALMDTYIGSMRKVDFRQMQTNFLVVFPTGVLENAPQFHVLVTKVPSNQISAQYQQALIKDFPNISVVDLALIIQTLEDVISKISFVIRFMALFSMVTGLLVLFGSVLISKFQRIKETVLLRTLGASGKQIIWITALEYAFLGMLSSFVGILLSLAGSWALAIYSFESRFAPSFLPILLIFLSITAITVLIGVLNNRDVLQKPPLEVLRNEV